MLSSGQECLACRPCARSEIHWTLKEKTNLAHNKMPHNNSNATNHSVVQCGKDDEPDLTLTPKASATSHNHTLTKKYRNFL